MSVKLHSNQYASWYAFNALKLFSNIVHGCSTRIGGYSVNGYSSLNLGTSTGDEVKAVELNRSLFLDAISANSLELVLPQQTHSLNVVVIDGNYLNLSSVEKKHCLLNCDALITNLPGLFLAVLTADCIPIMLYDTNVRAIAAIHSGWKGCFGDICSITIDKMVDAYKSNPENIVALIGPSISGRNYEVDMDLAEMFQAKFNRFSAFISRKDEHKMLLDLPNLVQQQLVKSGLEIDNIDQSGLCTYDLATHFFSYRRDGQYTGRMMSGLGMVV